jgi:mono/diheme cytochrome c family protein
MRILLTIAALAACLGADPHLFPAASAQTSSEPQTAPAGQDDSSPDERNGSQGEQNGSEGANAAPAAGGGNDKSFDVKGAFRNVCSFCHQDYGRRAGRGPQLMNSKRSDEFLFDRIKNGVHGRMPAFGGNFTDDQIKQIVEFIRELKPGEVPSNPG